MNADISFTKDSIQVLQTVLIMSSIERERKPGRPWHLVLISPQPASIQISSSVLPCPRIINVLKMAGQML